MTKFLPYELMKLEEVKVFSSWPDKQGKKQQELYMPF